MIKFVAPAYPKHAKANRIMGKTLTLLTINRDGFVKEVKTIAAHRVFEHDVLEALKQWRFKPSDHEYTLEVTCLFELTVSECEDPITSETHVSAELPSTVHIKTGLCFGIDRQ